LSVDSRYEAIDGKCKEGVISHFQGWKRNFYQFTTNPPPLDANFYLITESGFIPYRVPSLGDANYGKILQLISPLGRLSKTDLYNHVTTRLDVNNQKLAPQKKLSGRGSEKQILNLSNASSSRMLGLNVASSYCAGFTYDVKKCSCPIYGNNIEIIHVDKSYFQSNDPNAAEYFTAYPITLITATWVDLFYDGSLDSMLDSWEGQKVNHFLLLF
jgi:hypothetical protein